MERSHVQDQSASETKKGFGVEPMSAEAEPASASARHRRFAVRALTVALVAGVLETIVHIVPVDDLAAAGDLIARMIIYTIVATLVVFLSQGRYWARMVLICTMSTLGLASLLAAPLVWVFTGPDASALIASAGIGLVAVCALRLIHILAVIAAVIVMLRMGLRPARSSETPVDR